MIKIIFFIALIVITLFMIISILKDFGIFRYQIKFREKENDDHLDIERYKFLKIKVLPVTKERRNNEDKETNEDDILKRGKEILKSVAYNNLVNKFYLQENS